MEDINITPSSDEALTGEIVEGPIVGIGDDLALTPLDADQARELTDTIKDAAEVLWMLIARAHAGRAWLSLGYESWEKYVRAEFDMSRSRSYQILDQARVITAIENAVPEGAHISLSAAAAADLKGQLDTVVEDIRTATDGKTPEEAEQAVADYVEAKREEIKATSAPQSASEALTQITGHAINEDDEFPEDDDFEEYAGDPAPAATLVHSTATPKLPPATSPVGVEDASRIRRNVNAAHDLYSSLSALSSLPDEIDEIVAIIPAERYDQIRTNLAAAVEKLSRFQELWEAKTGSHDDETA